MDVHLTPQQRDLLLELVDQEIAEMGPEIHHTRTRSYRQDLKGRRSVLAHLRAELAGEPHAAAEAPDAADVFSAT